MIDGFIGFILGMTYTLVAVSSVASVVWIQSRKGVSEE